MPQPPAALAQPGATDVCTSSKGIPIADLFHSLAGWIQGTISVNGTGPIVPPESLWNSLLRSPSPAFNVGTPSCYVQVRTAQDVLEAVNFAMRHGLKVSAKGTGHHYGGLSLLDGAMVIDLSQLNHCSVDAAQRLAVAGPGTKGKAVKEATAPHGLHFVVGHLSEVGLGGYLLGGGNGWGTTKWGAAVDSIESMQVVTLDGTDEHGAPCGRMQRVDRSSHPELFWGLRGAGAFLGIVTEFTLRLHPVPASLPCMTAFYPLDALQQVGTFYREFESSISSSVEAAMSVVYDPEQRPVVVIGCTAFIEPDEQVQQAYDKLRAFLPDSRLDLLEGPVPYLQALTVLDPAWSWDGLCMYGHGMFVKRGAICEETLEVLRNTALAMPSKRSIILVAPTPGEPSAGNASAFGFQGDTYFLALYAMWQRTQAGPAADGDEANVEWVQAHRAKLQPHVQGLYVNEVMHDDPAQLARCYEPEAYERLRVLKRQVDPHGLLRKLGA